MKYMFVGDIHCNIELFKKVLEYGEKNNIHPIFVGDYLDSFTKIPYDGVEILRIIESYPTNKATFLLGNHDLSYLNSSYQCSGFKGFIKFEAYYLLNLILLKPNVKIWHIIDEILISHAGLSKSFEYLGGEGFTMNSIKDVRKLLSKYIPMSAVRKETNTIRKLNKGSDFSGLLRYNSKQYNVIRSNIEKPVGGSGGLTWLRPNDWSFQMIPNVTQIVGHTPTDMHYDDIKQIYSIYNIQSMYSFEKQRGDILVASERRFPNSKFIHIDNNSKYDGDYIRTFVFYDTKTKEIFNQEINL